MRARGGPYSPQASTGRSVTVTVTNLSQASLGRPSPRALKPRAHGSATSSIIVGNLLVILPEGIVITGNYR